MGAGSPALGSDAGDRGCWMGQAGAARGAVSPAGLRDAVALRAGGRQGVSASGAIAKAGLDHGSATGAADRQRFAEQEVKDNADPAGREDGQQGPHCGVHVAPRGIAVDICEECDQSGDDCDSQNDRADDD